MSRKRKTRKKDAPPLLVVVEFEGEFTPERVARLGLPGGPVMAMEFENGQERHFLIMRGYDWMNDCRPLTYGVPDQFPDASNPEDILAFLHGSDCTMSRWISTELPRVRDGQEPTEFIYCERRMAGGMFDSIDIRQMLETKDE